MPITEPEGWIPVAVGIARDPIGHLLVDQRPMDKVYPGKWEFPGGKLEPGESVFKALVREFREELGLEIIRAESAFVVRHRYPDRSVELNVWRVIDCSGEATGREGQVVRWVPPWELPGLDFLEGNQTIVERIIREVGS